MSRTGCGHYTNIGAAPGVIKPQFFKAVNANVRVH